MIYETFPPPLVFPFRLASSSSLSQTSPEPGTLFVLAEKLMRLAAVRSLWVLDPMVVAEVRFTLFAVMRPPLEFIAFPLPVEVRFASARPERALMSPVTLIFPLFAVRLILAEPAGYDLAGSVLRMPLKALGASVMVLSKILTELFATSRSEELLRKKFEPVGVEEICPPVNNGARRGLVIELGAK